jgi:hypothetical protein
MERRQIHGRACIRSAVTIFSRTTRRWSLSIRKEVLKDSRHSRLPNTKFGSNLMSGKTIGSKGDDVFLLSRGDGMHVELGEPEGPGPCYIH